MATEPVDPPSNVVSLHTVVPGAPESPAKGRVFGGTVLATGGGAIRVRTESGPVRLARRAAGCLLAPREADLVMCCLINGNVYVLAVLERSGEERVIEVEGDLTLRSRSGAVHVEAPGGDVVVRGDGDVQVAAGSVTVTAKEGTWVSRELRLLSEHLSLRAKHIVQESTLAERVADSLKERFQSTRRDVKEGEHVHAGAVTLSVRTMFRAHAETAITTAKKLIKLDGDQIHLG